MAYKNVQYMPAELSRDVTELQGTNVLEVQNWIVQVTNWIEAGFKDGPPIQAFINL